MHSQSETIQGGVQIVHTVPFPGIRFASAHLAFPQKAFVQYCFRIHRESEIVSEQMFQKRKKNSWFRENRTLKGLRCEPLTESLDSNTNADGFGCAD